MAKNDQVSVYSPLTAPSDGLSPTGVERAIHESATSDLLVTFSLVTSIVWTFQHGVNPGGASQEYFVGYLSRLETELGPRGIPSNRVLVAETLRSWCDLLVRQELQTPTFTANDANDLRAMIPSLLLDLPDNEEGSELRLLFLQILDALDAFLVERKSVTS